MAEHSTQFETTQDIIHEPLDRFEQLAQHLFSSLSQSGLRGPPPPSIDVFLETDAALASALTTARQHQVNQQNIDEMSSEILDLDVKLRHVWTSLDDAHKELGVIIEEGEERLKEMDQAAKGAVPYRQLLDYASILSGFTSAPPTSKGPIGADQPAPHWIKPPFPNEEKMRAGRLAERPALQRVNPKEPENFRSPSVDPVSGVVEPGFNPYRHDYQRHQAQMQEEMDLLDLDLNPGL
ncbi:Vitamin-D-receptor interacting mediator subunit 4 [Ceratobasidium theobromae]|uniref:Mediator of RNA polymerase II transcription subunit 4 n=1 Tax=Ceratobasidium theobromae TaxID=1582974 RepID=A0A5N5QEK8_9AGAM|nr:Vitamin-D-receptor interacting mediator subunit 4 [Ceratobasidium theobromae]